ncbi:MAG: PaaI family thioesterase [Pseudomonadota bacterium]
MTDAPQPGLYVKDLTQMADPRDVAHLTGLQYMQALQRGELPAAPIARTLGFWLEDVRQGRAVFRGRPSFKAYNPIGSVHGGWFGAILDSALGCAVHSALPAGKVYTTLEYKVGLVRALHESTGDVLATGEIVHLGRRTATAEARLTGAEDGKLYATGTTTCLVIELG